MSKAACILTTQILTKILRSKEAAASVNIKTWPIIIDTGTNTPVLHQHGLFHGAVRQVCWIWTRNRIAWKWICISVHGSVWNGSRSDTACPGRSIRALASSAVDPYCRIVCRRNPGYFSCSCFCLSDDLPRKRPPNIYKPPSADVIAYLDFSVSTTGMLTGVKVRTHAAILITATRHQCAKTNCWTCNNEKRNNWNSN